MVVRAIQSVGVQTPSPDWQRGFEPLPEKHPTGSQEVFQKDTIKRSEEAWEQLFPQFAGAFLPQQAMPLGNQDARPKLEAPSFDPKKLPAVKEEMASLMPKVVEEETAQSRQQKEQNLNEAVLLQLFLNCMKTQRDFEEVNAEISAQSVQKTQEVNKTLRKEITEEQGKLDNRKGISTLLKWIGYVFWAGLATAGVASLALTIATSGMTLPVALTILMAVTTGGLALATGGNQIAKAILDYLNKRKIGNLEVMRFERHVNTGKIREGMDQMKRSFESVSKNFDEAMKVVNNAFHASLPR